MNDGKWTTGQATYKRLGTGRRRVIVYGPSKRRQVASACNRAIRSWNWTIVVAAAFMIALVVTSTLSSHSTDPTAASGSASQQTQGRDVRVADHPFTHFTPFTD